jgi:catechol 2,3-dioxygenase-like lactoylglutathione lyase family enzyme
MELSIIGLRPFIGSKDFETSQAFYQELGFTKTDLGPNLLLFSKGDIHFYLQAAYVKHWIENTMLFFHVADTAASYQQLRTLDLEAKYPEVRLRPIRKEAWGEEFFLLDPAGVLLHFGNFIDNK